MGLLRPLLLSLALPLLLLFAGASVTARSGDGEGAPGHGAPELPEQGAPENAPEEPAASPVTIRFVEPQGLIQGVTRITLEATTSAGATIVRVEIYVDGTLLSILQKPPYTLTWNAGNRFHRKILQAVAHDSEGRRGETRLVTRPLLIGQYEEVRLINVYAIVRDRKSRPVLDLSRDDFILEEDGVRQEVTHFTSARVPLTVALLIDASNSMNRGGKLSLARKAAADFVKEVDEDDLLLVLYFNDTLHGSTEPVADRKKIAESIEAIGAEGGTALYDAVFRTAALMAGREGRRAIVLLSDGRDQALTDNQPGSLHLFEEALEKAHRADTAVYAVGLGRHLENQLDLERRHSLREILETFASQTGGRAYFPERAGQLSGIYKEIAADLRQQYGIGYSSTNSTRNGRWRSISLTVRDPEMKVQARAGYYAPDPGLP